MRFEGARRAVFVLGLLVLAIAIGAISLAAATRPLASPSRASCQTVAGNPEAKEVKRRAYHQRPDGGGEWIYESSEVPFTIAIREVGKKFNIMTASASTRKAYGIPPEPSASEEQAYENWQKMATHIHPERQEETEEPPPVLYVELEPYPAEGPAAVTQPTPSPTGSATAARGEPASRRPALPGRKAADAAAKGERYPNWAGYVVERKGVAFREAGAVYQQPREYAKPEGEVYFWAGIGGNSSKQALYQAGTALGELGQVPDNHAWFEIAPLVAAVPLPLCATPLGEFMVNVIYHRKLEATFFLYDFELQKAETVVVKPNPKYTSPLSSPPVGDSAEYIAERPEHKGFKGEHSYYDNLAKFRNWQIGEGWATEVSRREPWCEIPTKYPASMYEESGLQGASVQGASGGLLLAEPGPQSSVQTGCGFEVKWRESGAAQPEQPPAPATAIPQTSGGATMPAQPEGSSPSQPESGQVGRCAHPSATTRPRACSKPLSRPRTSSASAR